ncbi:genetic suppressor element 1-like [Gadus chalcogrammus]|uniref:genetic suppressor element 1-like n=1 Tax=Gadus chalcogrammus TaxID=1042646 RepID=UPI0024C495C0|nr:genetic suppressor element 1-like [Gadus chalcogrammus]
MNHGSRSPSLGMISTATRTTATVSPLSPFTNGNAVAQSANSGFAAALRKLAKQAEDPRGCPLSIESSPVSSPATSHSSPGTTPKRGSSGPQPPGLSRGHPGTPPVVPIAPIKSTNGLWRAEGGQSDSLCAVSNQVQQDKRSSPLLSPHPLLHPFGLSTVIQDHRMQSHSLPGQMHPVVPSGAVPEEYLRGLRPFPGPEDLRLSSLPLGLDPATAAHAAAAYYHPAYLHHPLAMHRMEESLCLSALRSQFYSVPAGGAFPSLHHSGLHLHLPGARYPGELNHTALADRLQMENELRQRDREQEREREKERERERERERDREGEKERERERDLERQKERQRERQRERQQQMARAVESHYLAELQARRPPPEGRVTPGERLTPSRPDIVKEQDHPSLPTQKPLSHQHGLQSSLGSVPYPVPSLVPSHMGKHQAAPAAGLHGQLAAAMMSHRAGEEGWMSRQRRQERPEREGPSELCLRLPGKGAEPRRDMHRVNSVQHHSNNREAAPRLGAPPPLISPKTLSAHPSHPHHPPRPPHPPTALWNPASLVNNTPMDCHHKAAHGPPSRPPPGLTRADRAPGWTPERLEDGERSRAEAPDRGPVPGGGRGGAQEHPGFWSNGEQHRASSHHPAHQHHQHHHHHRQPQHLPSALHQGPPKTLSAAGGPGPRERQGAPAAPRSTLVYDEVLQQHRLLLSKLDLEEKRRKEAREGGFYYEVEESYDESDEEEVKAHLKRVTQQPPLKLDASSEKVEFLGALGLTTQRHRSEILERKRRKWRRMMKERSPSPPPPAAQGRKKRCPSPLTTPYTAAQMDSSPALEEKKGFLQMFSLAHVTPQQRRDKEHTEGLLRAIQQKTVTLDTLRYNTLPPCSSPATPPRGGSSEVRLQGQSKGQESPGSSPPPSHPISKHCVDPFKPYPDTQIPHPPLLALLHAGEKAAYKNTLQSSKKQLQPQGFQNSHPSPAPRKEAGPGLQNGRSRPWEKFTPEAFAQQFHHAVLQSTHHTLQGNGIPEVNMKANPSLPLNMSSAMKRPRVHSSPSQPAYHNGHHSQRPGAGEAPGTQERLSGEEEEQGGSGQEEEDEEEDEGEMEAADAPRKWSGIEAIFEAYQEYTEEWSVERQVLHGQCKRLEAQNHTLTRTAEQMSVTMGELVGQRQKVREERERLQAQLEHFRRCLTLPSIHWGRGQVHSHGAPR